MSRTFKAALGAVKEFLAGESTELQPADTQDKALRRVVAAELLTAMTPSESDGAGAITEEQERAKQLFFDHGYFDDTVQVLRAGESAPERAAAARSLGIVGSQRATAHLIAACFDDDAEVRDAAEEALARIGSPSAVSAPVASVTSSSQPGDTQPLTEMPVTAEPSASVSTHETETQPVTENPSEVEVTTSQVAEADKPSAVVEETIVSDSVVAQETTNEEPEQLRQEEVGIRNTVEEIEKRLMETVAERKEVQKQVRLANESEAQLRAEAAERRRKEEEHFKRLQAEAERLRAQEETKVSTEREARLSVSAKAHQLEKEESRLRLKAISLRQAATDLTARRGRLEQELKEAAEAARENEARRARQEAEAHHLSEMARLRKEEESFRAASEEVSMRRAEVEKARLKAEKEAQLLKEAEERMQAAESARLEAEVQRQQLETDINERMQKERRLLEEASQRATEEQKRLEEEIRRHKEEEERRKADLEALQLKTEQRTREQAEKERQILSQIESLRIADAETRRRIEDAETKRRAAEQAYSLVADKVQRIEAEAHARTVEEQKILARLEAARREAAVEAQARAEQEKRIKEEIEMFRRLEEEERPRLEAAILRRAQAEEKFQQQRERIEAEEEYLADLSDEASAAPPPPPLEYEATRFVPAASEHRVVPSESFAAAATARAAEAPVDDIPEPEFHRATPAIVAYLSSVDPYKRAAAIAELARSQAKDAFNLISECFDDHSAHVRNAAARALPKLEPNRTVDLFNRAMEEGSEERRRNIGNAIAASGLANEAINNLASESREATYNALSILFVMAKSGEVQPLVKAIEEHKEDDIGKAAIKLLTLSGKQDIADAALKRSANAT